MVYFNSSFVIKTKGEIFYILRGRGLKIKCNTIQRTMGHTYN